MWQIMLAMANVLVFKTNNNMLMLWEAHIKELAILRRHVKLARGCGPRALPDIQN